MKITLELEFNRNDRASVVLAVTPEQVDCTKEEFMELLRDSVGVIQANCKAYSYYRKNGTLELVPKNAVATTEKAV